MTDNNLPIISKLNESQRLEMAEEVTDDESVENFRGVAYQIQCTAAGYDSNLKGTPYGNAYTDDNKLFDSQPFTTSTIAVPIVGYEIMEERARFTVYKLRVEHKITGSTWIVYRRYTDFKRLCANIKIAYPEIVALLPRKRWFGDNFEPEFINDRIRGLQLFVNRLLSIENLLQNCQVQDFFCLNEAPFDTERCLDESMVVCEALSENVCHLRNQIKERDYKIEVLSNRTANQQAVLDNIIDFLKQQTKNCRTCSESVSKYDALRRIYDELSNGPTTDEPSNSEIGSS